MRQRNNVKIKIVMFMCTTHINYVRSLYGLFLRNDIVQQCFLQSNNAKCYEQ